MFFKSNSVIIGFDKSSIGKSSEFNFLNFVQNASISVNAKRLDDKFLGSSSSIINQFNFPDISFNLSYLQRVDFLNEFLFGFNIIPSVGAKIPIAEKFKNGFLNENAFFIFSGKEGSDIINEIRLNQSYSTLMKYISFYRVFLNTYSIKYSINSPPVVDVSFLSSNIKIGNILQKTFNIQNISRSSWYLTNNYDFLLPYERAIDLYNQTNLNQNENIVYHMRNFSMSNTFDQGSLDPIILGGNIKTFLDGIIQSLDLNINFNRNKFWFFGKKNEDQKFIFPIKGSLKFSGLSSSLINGDIYSFFSSDKKFNITFGIGLNSLNKDYYELIIEDISINSIEYSIDINGMLNYSIDCYFEITETGGFFIKQVRDKDGGTDSLTSSTGDFLYSTDGNPIQIRTSTTNIDLPQINPQISVNFS